MADTDTKTTPNQMCCCCSNRSGCIAIGAFRIVATCAFCTLILGQTQGSYDKNDSITLTILLISLLIEMAFNGLLICGAIKKSTCLLKVWIFYACGSVILIAVQNVIASTTSSRYKPSIFGTIIGISILCYFIAVVRAYHDEVHSELEGLKNKPAVTAEEV